MNRPADEMIFFFNGKKVEARSGDTVASALYRSGRRIFSRSFKYHRPRGLLCLAGKCPNCLMNVDGAPNVRVCATPVREGMQVRHQNAWPSLERDWLSAAQRFDFLMPVGWYYKTFTNRAIWRAAAPLIRKVAGLGEPPKTRNGDPGYEHSHRHVGVAVIGGGPAGLEAALERGTRGEQVLLVDDQPELGGHWRYSGAASDLPGLLEKLRALPNVELMSGAYCFGLYEGNLLGVVQRRPHEKAVERLVHVRARHVVVATGAYEVPLLFENNDLVGVMLSSAVQRLIRLHGVKPGERAVIVGTGGSADGRAAEIESELRGAGVRVEAMVPPEAVLGAAGPGHVTGIETRDRRIPCDVIVICGPRVPDAGLLAQAGGRLEWNADRGAFVPADLPSHVSAVGEVTGAALSAAAVVSSNEALLSKRAFVCLCTDATSLDLKYGVAEGFDQIETLKRYTTATMGPCQGRMCQLGAISVCSRETGRAMGATGVTTSRPPNPPVSLGALAGARHHPVRRTPLHYVHQDLDAVWLDMGAWKRPRFYRTRESSEEMQCVKEEYLAVRERAGLIDVSTLGKLDVKGRDAGRLLDKVYTNRFSNLKPGRVRYSVICDEAGIVLDDGTISRMAEDHYFITTTTGNLDFVEQWLEWWLIGTGWDVHITNVTGGLAAVNIAGPKARDVLGRFVDCSLETQEFPYMACRLAAVAGAPALLLRIGFVGETGWEIHFPAEHAERLWGVLLDAGKEFGIRPFGVEAQRLLRLEKKHVIVGVDTDALSTPYEAGMAWVAKLDKEDFIGRAALRRIASERVREKLVGFEMEENVLPKDGSAVVIDGRPAGRVTSVRYSPRIKRAIGLAWVPEQEAGEGEEIQIPIDGRLARARLTHKVFYDAEGARLRM